jgi:hypothetical protein
VRRGVALAACVLLQGACGGSPTDVDDPPPSAYGLEFEVTPDILRGTTVELRWSGLRATAYRVEIGSAVGTADLLSTEVSATSYTWSNAPVGVWWARVVPSRPREGLPSNSASIRSLDAREIVEALFLGTGPLADSAIPTHVLGDRIEGWSPGSTLSFIVDDAMPATSLAELERTLPQIVAATGGALIAVITDRRPHPGDPAEGEVSVTMVPAESYATDVPCIASSTGCARTFFRNGVTTRARIWIKAVAVSTGLVAHEIGHVYGLAHIVDPGGIRPTFTMVAFTSARVAALEPASLRAMEAVARTGLYAGAGRPQLLAADLIPPTPGIASRAMSGADVVRVGDEIVVTRPFCE